VPNTDRERLAEAQVPEALVEGTIVVVTEEGRKLVKGAAIAELLGVLPLGWLWALPLRLPGLAELADALYDRVSRNRTRISQWLGLAACGVPKAAGSPASAPEPEPAPVAAAWRRLMWGLQQVVVAVLVIAATSQLIMENHLLRTTLGFEQPAVLRKIVNYPRLRQGWAMFAPSPPRGDMLLVIDAETVDGRHVDPLAWLWRGNDEVLGEIPPHAGLDQFWCDYMVRIKGFRAYHETLREWIARHHRRTGRPQDRIVRYEVIELTQRCPEPHQGAPTGQGRHVVLAGTTAPRSPSR
jgi:hypothetical protein